MDARTDPSLHASELTWRGLLLGAGIIAIFMAANVYMGLKTGMTFSSSIPAAMISMGLLRLFGNTNILENNIVQTQASAAGTLCNVILVLPGLVLIGHWQGFPFWQTTAVCLLGGLLGVAYSIPLRRAMVADGKLPYPEGKAAAEVLHAGEAGDGGRGLRDLLGASAVAGTIALATSGLKLLAEGIHATASAGPAIFRLGTGFSLALVGVGYLVGIGACLALLAGVAIAWGIAVPLLTAFGEGHGATPAEIAEAVWLEQVRLIGAGIIAVGGVWTVGTLASPILASIRSALDTARAARSGQALRDLPRQDRDLPITWVAAAAAGLALPLAGLIAWFAAGTGLGRLYSVLIVTASLFIVSFEFLMAAACGYLAGLLGSSSSPISGIGILTTIVVAILLPVLIGRAAGPEGGRFVIGMALLVASVIVTIASIANDNLQDLKTGQLVGATPWRQQIALIVGVSIGALVIAPLLSLLYQAYGFVGSMPREGMQASAALPAPQAALITQIASGIVHGQLPWTMVLIGMGLGAVFVGIEAWLRRRNLSFPALTVGIGMYLPLNVEMTIAVGGVISWLSTRSLQHQARARAQTVETVVEPVHRRGILLASGFLVGESFVGVLLAAADTITGRNSSLAVAGPDFAAFATWLGAITFVTALVLFYLLVSRAPTPAISTRG
ncbi:OPT family oligopeptide transporter [Methylobacterium nigriterrae]|uniref:OPT family oligopeptide transporter n=1 Tax=Methylobacterium nigriterrae TaxID=3127512 RepID=UPI00301327EE